MFKRNYFLLAQALLLAVFFTTGLYAQKKVALTTIFVDRYIGTSDLSANASLAADILTMTKDSNFNLQPVLENFKTTFTESFAKDFPFDMIPEATVLGNQAYQDYKGRNWPDYASPLVAEGYKVMYPGVFLQKKENRDQVEMLQIFPEADGVMFVFMNFSFVKKLAIGGTGVAGIRATCQIWLYNKEGKSVFSIVEGANSKGTVGLVGGIPIIKTDKILPLCTDAAAELLEDLKGRMPKMTKKAASKL